MKKVIILLLIALMILPISACDTHDNTEHTADDKNTSTEKQVESESLGVDETLPSVKYDPFYYSSPEDLLESLKANPKDYFMREYRGYFKKFDDLLLMFEEGEVTLKYPVIEGFEEDFLTKDILLFAKEGFGLPWIWYRRWYDDTIMLVSITYLRDDVLEYSRTNSLLNTIKYIARNAYGNNPVDEKSILTKYGTTKVIRQEVESTIESYPNTVYLTFIVDDMLVDIKGTTENVDYTIINKLRFVPVE